MALDLVPAGKVEDFLEAKRNGEASFEGTDMSRSTSASSLNHYATALSSPALPNAFSHQPTPLSHVLSNQSQNTSTNSSFSRQSSVRSTDSVQAIPLRGPPKTPLHSPVMSRQASGLNYPVVSSAHTRAKTEGDSVPLPSPITGPNVTARESGPTGYPQATLRLADSDAGLVMPPRLPAGRVALVPHPITTGLQVPFHIPLPTPAWTPAAASVLSLPPTPTATNLLRPTRPGLVSRSASAMSLGVVVRRSTSDFDFGQVLGEGSFSTVYYVKDKQQPHREYALKILDKRHIVKERKQKYVNVEKDALNKLERHPGVIRLYWTFHDERSLYFVLELANNGEILKWIKRFGSFSIECARYYGAQLLSAIEHIHSRDIIHRDLKPENILLDHNMRIKITDFGSAKIFEPQTNPEQPTDRGNSFVGTAEYVSPELLESKVAYRSSDFWAFACILFQMIAGRVPFKAGNEYLTFQKILHLEYTFPDDFPNDAKDLISQILILDPSTRLGGSANGGIAAIKNHTFFSGLDLTTLWTTTAPPLASGLAPPPPTASSIMSSDLVDYFGFADGHFTPESNWPLASPQMPHDATGEDLGSSVAAELPPPPGKANGNEAARRLSKQAEDKWSACLLPSEYVLYSSTVMERSGLIKRKRHLVLTNYPRLLCLQENKTKVKIRTEVILGAKRSNGLSAAVHPTPETFISVIEEPPKQIRIQTSAKSYRYEDLNGSAHSWAQHLRQAHEPVEKPP